MSLLPVWLDPRALALAAGAAVMFGVSGYATGRLQQYFSDQADRKVEILEAAADAAKKTDALKEEHRKYADTLKDELLATERRASALADELRTRPGRMPEPARATCKGATGAELSGPDAGFLARYAASARKTQLDLEACLDREQANYNALKPK